MFLFIPIFTKIYYLKTMADGVLKLNNKNDETCKVVNYSRLD